MKIRKVAAQLQSTHKYTIIRGTLKNFENEQYLSKQWGNI